MLLIVQWMALSLYCTHNTVLLDRCRRSDQMVPSGLTKYDLPWAGEDVFNFGFTKSKVQSSHRALEDLALKLSHVKAQNK